MTKMYQKIHIVLFMMKDMNRFLWMLMRSQRKDLKADKCTLCYARDRMSHAAVSGLESQCKCQSQPKAGSVTRDLVPSDTTRCGDAGKRAINVAC